MDHAVLLGLQELHRFRRSLGLGRGKPQQSAAYQLAKWSAGFFDYDP